MAAVALMAGFSSCSNDEDVVGGGKVTPGEPTSMELRISFENPGTYGTADPNATADEAAVKTVSVFIFDYATNKLVSRGDLVAADFTQTASGSKDLYVASKKVTTTTGLKRIYVGVNLPAEFQMAIGQPFSKLTEAVNTTVANLTSSTNGFAMFSADERNTPLVAPTDASYQVANTVTVRVERLVAKVAVQASGTLSLASGGGVLSNLEFCIGQSNKKMYRFKFLDMSNVKDPNWDTYEAADFETFSDYVAINSASVANNIDLTAKYATENTSKLALEKEVTYASVRARFVPGQYLDGTGAVKPGTPVIGTTFWMVSLNDGTKNYFDVSSEADAYVLLHAADGAVKSPEYTNGYCYFTLFLNPKGKYNVIRNSFFKATITKIVAPGNPTPDPLNPTDPVKIPTDMTCNLEVLPWTLISDNYELE
jgi:hypothetical protein